MKRAAVQWGIGRILYNMEPVWVDIEQKGKSWYIKKAERTALDRAYLDMLRALKVEAAPAGGLQSLLTSQGDEDLDETTGQKTGIPAIPPKDGASADAKKTGTEKEERTLRRADYAYIVTAMQTQKGMNTINTLVRLRNAEGREIPAYAQGEHALLIPGTMLSDAKLTLKKQDTVVYYILESYRIIPPDQRAA